MNAAATKLATALIIGLLPPLLTGCRGLAQGEAKHSISVQVHPPHATVWLYEAKRAPIAAALEQRGPLAAFDLPVGDYTYQVRAPGFETYHGTFSLPQNRELSVWLNDL